MPDETGVRERRRAAVTERPPRRGQDRAGEGRCRGPVRTCDRSRPRHGALGAVPLHQRTRRAAHAADRRGVRRAGRPRRGREWPRCRATTFADAGARSPERSGSGAWRTRTEYALLYGSPVPDFHANAEDTNRAGQRVTDMLAALGRNAPPSPSLSRAPRAAGPRGVRRRERRRGPRQRPRDARHHRLDVPAGRRVGRGLRAPRPRAPVRHDRLRRHRRPRRAAPLRTRPGRPRPAMTPDGTGKSPTSQANVCL